MAETNIDKAYNEMLEVADKIALNEDLTQNDIDKYQKDIKECVNSIDSVDITATENTSSAEVSSTTPEDVMQSYDPATGDVTINDTSKTVKDIIDHNWDTFVTNGNNIVNSIMKELANSEMSDDDSSKVLSAITRRLDGEKFNCYEALPTSIQKEINHAISIMSTSTNIRTNINKAKELMASQYIDEMVSEYKKTITNGMDLDTILAGFNSEIEKYTDQMSTELGGMMMSFDDDRRAELDAAIARCNAEGKDEAASRLLQIKNTLSTAYDLTDFKEFCKACKIKRFETEKTSRVFDGFNFKYEKHQNTINDIRSCPGILNRHFHDYTSTQSLLVCLAFCKYCANKSPDNMEDHTFMYYFIRNIIMLDRLNPKGKIYDTMDEKSKNFYDGFTKNLKECIDNLLVRNPSFNTYVPV